MATFNQGKIIKALEKAMAYAENPADARACEKMGRLYDAIKASTMFQAVIDPEKRRAMSQGRSHQGPCI